MIKILVLLIIFLVSILIISFIDSRKKYENFFTVISTTDDLYSIENLKINIDSLKALGAIIKDKIINFIDFFEKIKDILEQLTGNLQSLITMTIEENLTKVGICLARLHNQKILVVDDNLTNRTLLGLLLTKWQVKHTLVDSGKKALESLTKAFENGSPYNIAILDMQMPEMDGFQLAMRIKEDSRLFPNTRLMMLTSQGQRGDAEKLKEAGFNGYLNKPIDQSILYNTLMTIAGANSPKQPLVTAYSARQLPQFNARVLVVEDNAVNQKVAQGLLKKFGIQVDIAANGQEALNTLENLPFDLVLMDCQMPVMDGYEATQKIRLPESKVLNQRISIVAMTANSMQGDRDKCLSVGMDDFISKPVNPSKLQEALKRWLPESKSIAVQQGNSQRRR